MESLRSFRRPKSWLKDGFRVHTYSSLSEATALVYGFPRTKEIPWDRAKCVSKIDKTYRRSRYPDPPFYSSMCMCVQVRVGVRGARAPLTASIASTALFYFHRLMQTMVLERETVRFGSGVGLIRLNPCSFDAKYLEIRSARRIVFNAPYTCRICIWTA